ncbi:MAG: hypothetical protein GY913_22095 [Proteobacteria bacterium]|nr:hypothetical protein [Pseudomonadota bacterium]
MTLLLWLACTDKDPLADSGLDSDPIDTGSLDSDPPVDADGDGFDEDEDCDDDNDAVHPGADELCNMQDDDCDGAIDEDAVDADVGWFDADGDGYGAGDEVAGCALELVDNADDCNDDNDTVNPGADEVCDGVDNDCDEVGDGNAVPGDFATLQDAADGLADGSEICVQPGTWAESVDVSGRTLTFRGADRDTTLFEVGDTPSFTADGSEVGSGELTLIGLTVSGELAVDDDVTGAFAWAEASSIRLEDIAVTELDVIIADGELYGAVVGVTNGTLAVDGLAATDVTFDLQGGTDKTYGGLVWADDSDVTLQDVTVERLDSTASSTDQCKVDGMAVFVEDGTLAASALSMTDSHAAWSCGAYASVEGWFLFGEDIIGTIDGLEVDASSVTLEAEDASGQGLVECEDCEIDWTDVTVTDNELSAEGTVDGAWNGLIRMDYGEYTLSGATVTGNSVTALSDLDSARAYGGLYASGAVEFDHLDIRDNHVLAGEDAYGAGLVLFADNTATVTNFILAGNTVECDGEIAAGAGFHTALGDGHVTLVNGDIVGNSATGAATEVGGAGVHGRYVARATIGQNDATNVNVVDNDVWMEDGVELGDWAYTNAPDADFDGDDWTADEDGNLSEDPLYTNVTGDATDWDLQLQSSSAAIDAGDPSILNDDGSTSDIGAYGGPDGTTW